MILKVDLYTGKYGIFLRGWKIPASLLKKKFNIVQFFFESTRVFFKEPIRFHAKKQRRKNTRNRKRPLSVQIKMASTKRDNCARKIIYADGRKFRQKNRHLTVVYVQRLCYPDTKTCFKMHSITAKYGKT